MKVRRRPPKAGDFPDAAKIYDRARRDCREAWHCPVFMTAGEIPRDCQELAGLDPVIAESISDR